MACRHTENEPLDKNFKYTPHLNLTAHLKCDACGTIQPMGEINVIAQTPQTVREWLGKDKIEHLDE